MKIFSFGEKVKGYKVKVLNEREARAAAGILFLFSIVAFLNAILIGNFELISVFILGFLIDFIIRVLINPKYSPSMIAGRIAVRKQTPEYTGAPQKRFAWGLGLVLAIIMSSLLFFDLSQMMPLFCLICLLCLIFLFFESAFGICIGCKIYNLLNKEKAKLCPGGVCENGKKEEIQKISIVQISVFVIFLLAILALNLSKNSSENNSSQQDYECAFSLCGSEEEKEIKKESECEIPSWVKFLGKEERYIEKHCN